MNRISFGVSGVTATRKGCDRCGAGVELVTFENHGGENPVIQEISGRIAEEVWGALERTARAEAVRSKASFGDL